MPCNTAMREPLLAVRDLAVEFATDDGIAEVLDRVDLDIGPGEVVGLVGESGCGKTTLARAILGVVPAPAGRIRSGRIEFDGEDLLAKSAGDMDRTIRGRAITFIPQDPYGSFNPLFSVGSQIRELMKWKSPGRREEAGSAVPSLLRRYPSRRAKEDRERVRALLNLVQIPRPEEALRKLPHEFSGGQRQRLMIAMALLPEPRLIIADEPTTALDVTIQAQILGLLRRLVKDRGISVLFTTHDLGTAYELCDKVSVMYAGQEMESAPAAAFFGRPAHPYTARLLESLPRPGRPLAGIGGEVPVLVDPPAGCRFHPRCGFATAECRHHRPAARDVDPGHTVRCHHPLAGSPSPSPSPSPSRSRSPSPSRPSSATPSPA